MSRPSAERDQPLEVRFCCACAFAWQRRWCGASLSPSGPSVVGAGLEFVILAADGRIATDYQFVE
jgi:hypothetical protein